MGAGRRPRRGKPDVGRGNDRTRDVEKSGNAKGKEDNSASRTGEDDVVAVETEEASPRPWAVHRDYGAQGLAEKDFLRLSEMIRERYGINIKTAKKVMLEARLRRRLRKLNIRSFREYCDYLFSPEGMAVELTPMIDEVTTNKTDFFREPVHFDYLRRMALPTYVRELCGDERRRCAVWSAGCSTGEEPYTLAMVLREYAEEERSFSFRVYATDVSTKVLDKAVAGIYDEDKTNPVPEEYKKKYLMRSKDRSKRLIRVVPELRSCVTFFQLNFFGEVFELPEPMDIVFCRNVIIYFDRVKQNRVMNRICNQIRPGGYLFMGHSETLHGLELPVSQVAPTIYRKPR